MHIAMGKSQHHIYGQEAAFDGCFDTSKFTCGCLLH